MMPLEISTGDMGAFKLIIEDDAGKQIVVPFTRDVITIGRKEGNTIRLTERNVSRAHAKLSKENGHVVIEDLGSFNGIKLNGDRIDGRVLVHEGDTIQIGDYHLALHAQGEQASANAQTANGGGHAPPRSSAAANPAEPNDDEFAGDTQRWEPPQGLQGLTVQSLPTQEDRAVISDEHTAPAPIVTVRTTEGRTSEGAGGGGFGADNGDTERVTMDMLSQLGAHENPDSAGGGGRAMMPSPTLPLPAPPRPRAGQGPTVADRTNDRTHADGPEPELEPTVRQAPSPNPISMPTAQPVAGQGPGGRVEARGESVQPVGGSGGHAHAGRPQPRPPGGAGEHGPPAGQAQQLPSTPAAPRANPLEAQRASNEQTEAVRPSPGTPGIDEHLPRLVVLNTVFAGSTWVLRSAEAVIGRTDDNDITIEHKSVSRNHAKVVREGDRVRILDLKSANGVLVNNEEVEQAVLRSGDIVELGRVRLRFVPVGERFSVPPDEIERARLADKAGDDFEADAATGVTNPVRKKQAQAALHAPSAGYDVPADRSGRGIIFIVGGIVAVALIVAIVLVVMNSGDDDKGSANDTGGADKPVTIARVDDPPATPPGDTGTASATNGAGDAAAASPPATAATAATTGNGGGTEPGVVDDGPPGDEPAAASGDPKRKPDKRVEKSEPKKKRLSDAEVEKQLDNIVSIAVQQGDRPRAKKLFKELRAQRGDHERVKAMEKAFTWLKD